MHGNKFLKFLCPSNIQIWSESFTFLKGLEFVMLKQIEISVKWVPVNYICRLKNIGPFEFFFLTFCIYAKLI